MALNKVMLIGNVGNDPEVRYLESNPQNPTQNVKVATIRLATTERFRDRNGELRENTEWHNVVVWRNNADVVEKFVRKGSQIYVEGKLRTRQWTDQTGNKRFTTEIVADNLQLLGKRPEGDSTQPGYAGQGGYGPSAQPGSTGGYNPAAPAQPGYSPSVPAGFQPASAGYPGAPAAPGYQGASPAPGPASAQPSGPGAPASHGAPAGPGAAQPSVGPAVNPAYQGPLPAAESPDDLPF